MSSNVLERCSSSSSASAFCFSSSLCCSSTSSRALSMRYSSWCLSVTSSFSRSRCSLRTPFSSWRSCRLSRSSVRSSVSACPMESISLTISLFFLVMDCLRILFYPMRTSVNFAVLANSNTQERMSSFNRRLFRYNCWIILAS